MSIFNFSKKQKVPNRIGWDISPTANWVFPDDKATTYIQEGYKQVPNCYSIISSILKKTTLPPVQIMKIKNKKQYTKYKASVNGGYNVKSLQYKAEALEEVNNHELYELFSNPNSYQDINSLWWEIDGYKLLTGNSYCYVLKVGNKPKEMHSIPSPFVTQQVKGSYFEPVIKYQVSYLNASIPQDEMLHFKFWSPISTRNSDGYSVLGQSPLQACRGVLGRYKDAEITQGFQFKNQGPAGIISADNNNVSSEQATAMQDKFSQAHSGKYKAGKILVTPVKLSWVKLGLSPADLNITESKRESTEELCNAYNVPPEMYGGEKKYNNFEQARKAFITDGVIPVIEARKALLNFYFQKTYPDIVIDFDYTVFNELQDDMTEMREWLKDTWELTPNQRLTVMGFEQNQDPLMDKIYVPNNLQTIEDINEQIPDINL